MPATDAFVDGGDAPAGGEATRASASKAARAAALQAEREALARPERELEERDAAAAAWEAALLEREQVRGPGGAGCAPACLLICAFQPAFACACAPTARHCFFCYRLQSLP